MARHYSGSTPTSMPAFAELPAVPGAIAEPPPLRLKRGEDRRLRAGHLWVFSNEVDNEATPLLGLPMGAVVRVLSDREQFLGYAYVNPHALICARILSRSPVQPPDRSLLVHRLRVALALRERLYTAPYYRWVFGESDGLPGLVLDRYGEIVVGQIATAGMEALRSEVEAAVAAVLTPHALIWKNDSAARELEQLPRQVLTPIGRAPEELRVLEGSLSVQPAAGRGAENRLVLRSERQPRAVATLGDARHARARRMQLRRRVGDQRAVARRRRGAVRGCLRGRARGGCRAMPPPTA